MFDTAPPQQRTPARRTDGPAAPEAPAPGAGDEAVQASPLDGASLDRPLDATLGTTLESTPSAPPVAQLPGRLPGQLSAGTAAQLSAQLSGELAAQWAGDRSTQLRGAPRTPTSSLPRYLREADPSSAAPTPDAAVVSIEAAPRAPRLARRTARPAEAAQAPPAGGLAADPAARQHTAQAQALAAAQPSQAPAAPAATPPELQSGTPSVGTVASQAIAQAQRQAAAVERRGATDAAGAAAAQPPGADATAGSTGRAAAPAHPAAAAPRGEEDDEGDPYADTPEPLEAEAAAAGAEAPDQRVQAQPLEARPAPAADWDAPMQLPADSLVLPPRPPAPAGSPAPEGPPPELAAQQSAQRAYAELAEDARRTQAELQQLMLRTLSDMGDAHAGAAQGAQASHERALDALEAARERALQAIDRSAAQAHAALERAYRQTLHAAQRAGRGAHGRIAKNYQTADAQIGGILSSLVAGHVAAFTAAINGVRTAAEDAERNINSWKDARATHYDTGVGGLKSAHNEERQKRVPSMADQEKAAMAERKRQTLSNFSTSQTQSTGSIQCGYRCPLDQHKTAMNREGHAAVDRTLKGALKTLRRQTRQGREALTGTHAGARGQIEALARAARSRLASEARGTLQGLRGEATAAQQGVRGAAHSVLPALPRTAQRMEDSLRRAAAQGPQALGNAARQATPDLKRNVAQMRTQTGERLPASAQRLAQGLGQRHAQLDARLEQALAQNAPAMDTAAAASAEALQQTGTGFTQGFDQIAAQIARSADSWAQPFEKHFAAMIAKARTDVRKSLQSLLTGEPQKPETAAPAPAPARGGGPAPAPCPPCQTEAPAGAQAGAAAGQQPPGGQAAPEGPKGLTAQQQAEEKFFKERGEPLKFFEQPLSHVDTAVNQRLSPKVEAVAGGLQAGVIDTVDEGRVTGALRGLTAPGGNGVTALWNRDHSPDLLTALRIGLDPLHVNTHDYLAAVSYLAGRTVEGASHELQASVGVFNDDEARIEQTMGALTPAEMQALGAQHGAVLDDVRGALDGTDQAVFDALRQSNYALAGALRLRDRVDEARRDGDADATHTALQAYGEGPTYGGWQRQMEAEDEAATARGELPASDDPTRRHADVARRAVMEQLGGLVRDEDVAHAAGPGGVQAMSAIDRAAAYVTRPIEVPVQTGEGPPYTITMRIEGANRDLADALVRTGPQSPEARAARFGVELQRPDGARPLQVDRATFDDRFQTLDPNLRGEARQQALDRIAAARHDREEAIRIAATRYGGADQTASAEVMRQTLISQFRTRMGDDRLGGDLIAGLITDERPSPKTVAMAMRHGMYAHTGTDEEMLFHFTERMNRDEIAQMREQFRLQTIDAAHPTGRSLDAELGVYDEGGWFTELSGDDRLRMERALMGVPRNDRERLESAAFAIQQQRRETGIVGRALASGSYAEQGLNATERRLLGSVGGDAQFDRRGNLIAGGRVFNERGDYTGPARDDFMVGTTMAQQVAQNYSARIDAYANAASMGIAILGAIAAAVASVLTAGAASPLLMAAIAGITGLAAMGANYAIKGGRYGWEQALTDLGMTAVQALTAGVGQSLALASRGGMSAVSQGMRMANFARGVNPTMLGQMGRLTGSMLGDQLAIAAVTGGIGGMGNTALQEHTWEHGILSGLGETLYGGVKGAGSAAAGALVMNRLEAIPMGRGALAAMRQGGEYRNVGSELGRLSSAGGLGAVALRSAGRGLLSAGSGMATRGVELGLDAATGRFRGDAGDALVSVGESGLHSLVQGMGEGAAEAGAQGRYDRLHPQETAHREQERSRMLAEERALAGGQPREAGAAPHTPPPTEPISPRPLPQEAPTARHPAPARGTPAHPEAEVPAVARPTVRPPPEAELPGLPRRPAAPEETAASPRAATAPEMAAPGAAPEAAPTRSRAAPVEEAPAPARSRAAPVDEAAAAGSGRAAHAEAAEPARPAIRPPADPNAPEVEIPRPARLPSIPEPGEGPEPHVPRPVDPEAPTQRPPIGPPEVDPLAPTRIPEAPEARTRLAQHEATEGAAARIVGTEMTLSPTRVITDAPEAIRRALPDVLEHGPLANRAIVDEHGPNGTRLLLECADGSYRTVRVIVGETEGGRIAQFRPGATPDEYVVVLSPFARETVHARALAHELEELRFHRIAGHESEVDLLQPRSGGLAGDERLSPEARKAVSNWQQAEGTLAAARSATPPDTARVDRASRALAKAAAELPAEAHALLRPSAHDRGRLAELQVLDSQLSRARAAVPRDEVQVARLQHEAEALVGHLGLVGGPAAPARRAWLETALAREGAVRGGPRGVLHMLDDAIRGAQANPLLRPRPSQVDDLATLAAQMQRAQAMGDTATAERLRVHARDLVRSALGDARPLTAADIETRLGSKVLAGAGTDPEQQRAARALLADAADREAASARAVDADARARRLRDELRAAQDDANPRRIQEARQRVAEAEAVLNAQARPARDVKADYDASVRKLAGATAQEKPALLQDINRLRHEAARAALQPHEVDAMRTRLAGDRAELQRRETGAAELPARAQRIEDEIGRLAGRAETDWAHANRQPGDVVETRQSAKLRDKPFDPADELLPSRRRDVQDREAQAELVRQRFGDMPEFQEFDALLAAYYGRYPDKRRSPNRAAEIEDLYRQWTQGRYFSPETGTMRTLESMPILRAGPGKQITEAAPGQRFKPLDPNETMTLPPAQREPAHVIEAINSARRANGEPDLSQTEAARLRSVLEGTHTAPLTVGEAESLSKALVQARTRLENDLANPSLAAQHAGMAERLVTVETTINQVREAIGTAAGRRVAQQHLAGMPEVLEGQGPGTADLMFGDQVNGPLVVIECKGRATKGVGTRRAETAAGEPVHAEQGTPEYLRSLGRAMRGSADSDTADAGEAIVTGMATRTPRIRYLLVHQEINPDGSLGRLRVYEYEMYPSP